MVGEGRRTRTKMTVAQIEREERFRKLRQVGMAVGIAVILISGAVVAYHYVPKQPPVVHWHALYRVYVDGKLVSFENPAFDGMKYGPAHIHAPAYDKIHNEAKEGGGKLGNFFQYTINSKLTDTEMVLGPGTGTPGDYKVHGNETLQVWRSNQVTHENWTQIPDHYADITFHSADRYLILYGQYTTIQLQRAEAAYPDFTGAG